MKTYHVTQEDDRWTLKEDGFADALIEAEDRDEVLEETREYMKVRFARVLIHDANGQVVDERQFPEKAAGLARGQSKAT